MEMDNIKSTGKGSPTTGELTIEEVQRQAAKVKEEKIKEGQRIQLIVFKLGGEEYAISIEHIKEVVLTPAMAKVPQTPDYIKGIANIRGNIIAVLDLHQRFELGANPASNGASHGSYTLVIEKDKTKVGILVTEVPNTLTVYESDIDTASSIMQYSPLDNNWLKGIVKIDDRLIMLLDIHQMVDQTTLTKLSKL